MREIELAPERRERLKAHLQHFFNEAFDEPLSDYRANELLDMLLKTLGPDVYNQAVQDVRAHLQVRLDDLDGEVYADGDP